MLNIGEQTGLGRATIRKRILAGWGVEKALTTPLNASKSAIAKRENRKDGEDCATRI